MIKDIALDFIDFIRRGGEIGEGAELGDTMQGSPRLKELNAGAQPYLQRSTTQKC